MAVILETSIGDITVDLYVKDRPRCCLNFLKLCKVKYYNFSLFHSVQRNLAAQAGDPTGTGRGGHSIYKILYGEQASYFDAEMKPRIKHKKFGTLSMVNNGNNMHGSQFFITLGEDLDYLDRQMHTVFGEVGDGFETVKKFNETFVDSDNRPFKDIRIFHTVILDDPFDDPDSLAAHIPDSSPEPTKEQLESIRIGVDEDIDEDDGLSQDVLEERTKEKEAQSNAQILEMIGDLPAVDVRPPDNVLFVCKLNPVTSSEDLEIIFSRFGPIECCEVIKDRKTNESLQYAFIEFKEPKDCESAYFKMDNVLIDDRRIHVDFSQSVSKVKWNRKGKEANVKSNEKDDERPQFRIKDPDLRRDNKYDFVFDDDDDDEHNYQSKSKKNEIHKAHKKHKKEKNKHRHSSTDSESPRPSRHKKSHKDSSEHSSRGRYRSRSSSPKSRSHKNKADMKHHRRSPSSRDKDRSERHEKTDRREGDTDRHNSRDKKRQRDMERHDSRDRRRKNSRDKKRAQDEERHGSRDRREYDENQRDSADITREREERQGSSDGKRERDKRRGESDRRERVEERRNGSDRRRERDDERRKDYDTKDRSRRDRDDEYRKHSSKSHAGRH